MTPARWGRIKNLFDEARQRPESQRAEFLNAACADDAELRSEVEELLAEGDGQSLPSPAANLLDLSSGPTGSMGRSEAAAQLVDRYRLLQKVGEGGMGEVWLAEQREPVRRRVALKLIKAGMNTRDVMARFESERQALALMDHPPSPRCSMPAPRHRVPRTS
jgi:hypothetical protein